MFTLIIYMLIFPYLEWHYVANKSVMTTWEGFCCKKEKASYFRLFNGFFFFFTIFEQGASNGIYKEKMGIDYMKIIQGIYKVRKSDRI